MAIRPKPISIEQQILQAIQGHEAKEESFRAAVTLQLGQIQSSLDQIIEELAPVIDIESFTIQETTMLSISPGNSPQYTATPQPDGVKLVNGVPTWTSSDTTNAPVSVDSTGLVATVAIPSTATVETSFTLTISYTNADGAVATGSITQTIVAAVTDVTGFTIVQTA